MDKSESLKTIAVLIDADNAQLSKLSLVLEELSTYGRIIVRRAYGNWNSNALRNWEEQLKTLAIKPEQQFAYTTGKNATDISLAISAMDLLHTDLYDAFALVSSDSDYTPLAIRLREAGVYVFGVGEEKTPMSFRKSCDNFIITTNLTEPSPMAVPISPGAKTTDPKAENVVNMEPIHNLLKSACETYQEDDGFASIAPVGNYIKRVMPDFDPKTYGFKRLQDLIKDYPNLYETKTYPGKGTVTIFAYRCL